MKTAEIIQTLAGYHNSPEWAFLPELRLGTGYTCRVSGRRVLSEVEARVDAFAINAYPSKRCQRVAYEIKISRSDFTREICQPLKRRPALLLTNQFYFVTPAGLLKPEEIPQECGLMEIRECEAGYLVWKEIVTAPWRETGPAPWYFVAAIARRFVREAAP